MAVLLVDIEVLGVVRVLSPSFEVGPGEPVYLRCHFGRRVACSLAYLCCESRRWRTGSARRRRRDATASDAIDGGGGAARMRGAAATARREGCAGGAPPPRRGHGRLCGGVARPTAARDNIVGNQPRSPAPAKRRREGNIKKGDAATKRVPLEERISGIQHQRVGRRRVLTQPRLVHLVSR